MLFFILRCAKLKFNHGPKVMFALLHAASEFNFRTDSTGPLTEFYSVDTLGAFSTKRRITRKTKRLNQSARLAVFRHRQAEERNSLDAANTRYGPVMETRIAFKFLPLLFKQTSEECMLISHHLGCASTQHAIKSVGSAESLAKYPSPIKVSMHYWFMHLENVRC